MHGKQPWHDSKERFGVVDCGTFFTPGDSPELMVIFHESRRFELTVEAQHGTWTARFYEWVPGRLQPTLHLLRSFATRDDAIEAMRRKWHVLWPQAEPLIWRDPAVRERRPPARKRPRPTPRET